MKEISDDECVKRLRKKCKEVNISSKEVSSSRRGNARAGKSQEQRSVVVYAAKSSIRTVLESPSSEIRAEELIKPPSVDSRRSITGEEEKEKAVMNRVYIKSTKYTVGWVLDSEVNKCMSCNTGFGIFTRKHHCRQCGDIICHNCSKQKLQLAHLDENGGSRVCIKCMEIMYQDALMRRQKMNRKVYFSNVPSGAMLESSKQVQTANAAAQRINDNGNDYTKQTKRRQSSHTGRIYSMFSPEKGRPNTSDLFSIDDVYVEPPVEIAGDNPQSASKSSVQTRRDDVIKAALMHGVWEGSENGESTNPNSPLLTTTENTPGSAVNVEQSVQQQKQDQSIRLNGNQDQDKENSQLYESTFETPTKILQRRTQARVTHALTNGIWEAEEDGSISVASSDSPLSSSSSVKRAGSFGYKENNLKSNTSTPNSIIMGPYILQEGYLERRIVPDNKWSREKYKLLSSGILMCENDTNMNQINMKYASARGSRRNSSGDKMKAGSKRQYLIEIVHGDGKEKVILACATADEQVGWVASLMAFNSGNKNKLSTINSTNVNAQNHYDGNIADKSVIKGQQLVEKAILSGM